MESRNPGTRWWCVTYRRVPADTPRSGGAVHVAHHPHGIRGGCRLPEKARWPAGRDRGTRRVLSGSSCQRRPSIPAVPATSVHDLCAHFETALETMTAGGMERELLRPILAVRRRLVAPSMAPCGRDGAAGACRPRRRGAPLSQPPPAPPSRHHRPWHVRLSFISCPAWAIAMWAIATGQRRKAVSRAISCSCSARRRASCVPVRA